MASNNHMATLNENSMEKPVERFTVRRPGKIEVIEEKQKDKKQTSVGLALVKWISTILMFLLTLSCLVASKITVISIAQTLNSSDKGEKRDTSLNPDVAYVMIILIMLIPNFISFLRTFASSAFSITDMWPSKKSFFFGITGSMLEVAGLCAFTLVLVPTSMNFGRALLFMNGIFIFPILFQFVSIMIKCRRGTTEVIAANNSSYEAYENEKRRNLKQQENRTNLWVSIRLVIAGLFAIGGFVFVMYTATTTIDRVVIPLFMLCLSVAWSPKMFKLQTQPSRHFDEDDEIFTDEDEIAENIRIKSSRNRITLVTSIIKIGLIIGVAFGLNYGLGVASSKESHVSFKNGFENFFSNSKLTSWFWVQIVSSFIGYLMCWLACKMNLQKICFVIPLVLSTPIAVVLSIPAVCNWIGLNSCQNLKGENVHTIILGILLWLSQVLSYCVQFWKSQQFLMAPEDLLFWLPSYDGCLLEQYILLNRKNEVTDEFFVNYHEIVKNSHIYICTTMYHEADYEMEQLLNSLAKIDMARRECGRQFEAHIFFDDGARGDVVKLYALQLLSLVKDTMGIDPGRAFKLETPYGLQLKWALPHGMPFVLHLKDKVKVKAKKRWSQVMYMSYVLDFKQSRARDDLTYILATDADVKFTPNDVMALMDLMSRSPKVGAVCGRTHPMGSGPMVWYQVFDYAIGHWLLKVANHVCGSVLCSPGCFSVYRARAIRDVLPIYASGVDCAMDFLMKDMGEDRWFCTLLVEAGWKLEYCATSVDSTYCPETFDEFFKQRRRWGPSTFANSLVVIDKQSSIRSNNDAISFFFVVYQMVLMVSSIIGPSTVMLVIAGGLNYAYPYQINLVWVLVFLVIVSAGFTLICLFCSQDTQLKWAKFLTFVFAIIMSITLVGIILQTSEDVGNYISPPTKAPPTKGPYPGPNITTTRSPTEYEINEYIFTPATWYLFIITGVFILTALLHGFEGIYLIHGIWYLLCLPSGYLLLTIYSVANLTDRSWGTREGKTAVEQSDTTWYGKLTKYFKYFCWCCVPPHLREQPEEKTSVKGNDEDEEEEKSTTNNTVEDSNDDEDEEESRRDEKDAVDGPSTSSDKPKQKLIDIEEHPHALRPKKSAMKKKSALKRYPSSEILDERERLGSKEKNLSNSSFRFPGEKTVKFSAKLPKMNAATPVEEWLPNEYQQYVQNFKENGYDTVAFIAGSVKEKDLVNIGISNRGHRKRLVFFIDSLPPEEMFQEVPENVEEWLTKLGLEEYWPRFYENSYTEPRDLADIKYMSRDAISSLFDIKKEGHLKRLLMATSVLQYPTKAQTRIREARKAVMAEPVKQLKTDNADDGEEYEFWNELRDICLLPEQAAFNQSGELVEKLGDLRDTCLLVLAVANVLWLSFMVTIMAQGEKLSVFGSSFASVAFLMVYSVVLFIQFISLLWHRLETAVHFLARAPFKPGHMKSNWAWRDDDLPPPPAPELLEEIRRRKRSRLDSGSSTHSNDMHAPLISSSRSRRGISFNE